MRFFTTLFIAVFGLFAIVSPVAADELETVNAKSYFLVDTTSGEILAAQDETEALPPASMTKMMTAIVILDEIKAGKLSWEDTVTVSKRAADINEAQINLVTGEEISVKELFTALFVQSANDAVVAIAEHIAGSEEAFVGKMNEKAQELGLQHTHYQNATGLNVESYPDPPDTFQDGQDHVMSAEDTSIVARHLMKEYPEALDYTKIAHYTFHAGQANEQKVENWNKMLPTLKYEYPGVDGLKTGHTNAAGYCFTGTADQEGLRVVTVVMKTDSEPARFLETKKLLDYAYNNFSMVTEIAKDKALKGHETAKITDGVELTVPIAPADTLALAEKTAESDAYTYHVELKKVIPAPVKAGDEVGQVSVYYNGEPIPGVKSVPLVAQKDAKKASSVRLFFRQMWNGVESIVK